MTEAITNEQLRNFVHTSVSNDFGLTVAQVAEKAKYYGRFSAWLGGNVALVTEVLEIVKARGVSPAFFAAYEKTEGYNSSWGWLNHTYVNGTPTTDAASVAEWIVTQSNIMTGGPAWIDYANYKDFVPESVKTAGNADFQNMSAGSIGRVVIAGTAAAAWEVYYPNGLLAEYNGVQNYGAPITNMMETIIEWGGTVDGSGAIYPHLPVNAGTPITDRFGQRINPVTGEPELHNGTDWGGALNDPIYAVMTGEVIAVDYNELRGNWIMIKHDYDNKYSKYLHLNAVDVTVGQKVSAGQRIGYMGTTGQSTGVHLHLTITTSPESGFIDPEIYLATAIGGGGDTPSPSRPLPNNPTPPQYKHEEGREEMIYTVKKGDTLSEIAKKHNVDMKDILGVHHLGDWNKLDIGQLLFIPVDSKTALNAAYGKQNVPSRKYHIVKSGDNLWKIAGQYGLRVQDVIKLNTQLNNPDIIKVGEKIWLT